MAAPTTSFMADQLKITQTSPIVANRRDTIIRFSVPAEYTGYTPSTAIPGAPGSDSCGYPGNLWMKTIDASECLDVYKASIPWTGHTLCGFIQLEVQASDQTVEYVAQMDTTYINAYLVNGAWLQRVVTDSYEVSVKFARTLTFTQHFVTEFTESTTTDFVTVLIDGTQYDPSSRVMTVYLTVETTWPYMLDTTQTITATTFKQTDGTVASFVASSFTGNAEAEDSNTLSCSDSEDSVCGQMFIVTLTVDAGECDIAGTYTFEGATLKCRDGDAVGDDCPLVSGEEPTTTMYFEFEGTNLCDIDAADPSANIVPTLVAHPDSTLASTQTEFYTGDYIWFSYSFVSSSATVDSVSFAKIELTSSETGTDVIYDIENLASSVPAAMEGIMFEVHNLTTMVDAGETVNATFGFKLSPDFLTNTVSALRSMANGLPQQLTIAVTADVAFHGNSRKRVVSEFAVATLTASHGFSVHPSERSAVENLEKENTANAIQNSIWDLSTPEQSTELDSWFNTLDNGSGGNQLIMSLVIFFWLSPCTHLSIIIPSPYSYTIIFQTTLPTKKK